MSFGESCDSAGSLLDAAGRLAREVGKLVFAPPVDWVYNPLDYAWEGYAAYVRCFAAGRKRVLFFGMNPGPWGMVQTGVPFGEVSAVRDWMGLTAAIAPPVRQHPKRPVEGFACRRSEVSGKRLWGLFRDRFGEASAFFREHLVLNYCPLSFMLPGGANLSPDKLPRTEAAPLLSLCDRHLDAVLEATRPDWVLGIGAFAEARLRRALEGRDRPRIGRILHPSPASPAANRDWAGTAEAQLVEQGVWPPRVSSR